MHLRSVHAPGLLYLLVKILRGLGSRKNHSAHLSQETWLPGRNTPMARCLKDADNSSGTYRKNGTLVMLKKWVPMHKGFDQFIWSFGGLYKIIIHTIFIGMVQNRHDLFKKEEVYYGGSNSFPDLMVKEASEFYLIKIKNKPFLNPTSHVEYASLSLSGWS